MQVFSFYSPLIDGGGGGGRGGGGRDSGGGGDDDDTKQLGFYMNLFCCRMSDTFPPIHQTMTLTSTSTLTLVTLICVLCAVVTIQAKG